MQSEESFGDKLIGVTIVGRYRIMSKLGEGGMGVAYRAWNEHVGRPVVIKCPKKSFLEDPGFGERFLREIRLLQGLSHPHIVPIIDVGQHEGLPFVVLRFLPGGSLSDRRLRDADRKPRPNPAGMLHLWLPAIADALDHVHANGVVHRDVKPGNIFFDAFWGAFLGDFGIAKIVDESDSFDKEYTLTATHMGIGTQEYMGPEQFKPKERIDGKADQYALAVMVYEMLAGVRPFTGATVHLIVEVLEHPVPSIASYRRDLPASLVEAVHRGLAKTPAERFPNCRAFAAAVLWNVPPLEHESDVARLLCPNSKCGNIIKLSTEAAGREGKCRQCRGRMMVAEDLGALWMLEEARGTVIQARGAGVRVSRSTRTITRKSLYTQWLSKAFAAIGTFIRTNGVQVVTFSLSKVVGNLWQKTETRLAVASVAITACGMLTMLFLLALVVREVPHPEPRWILGGWVEVEKPFEEFESELPEDPGPQQELTDMVKLPESENVQAVQVVDEGDLLRSDSVTQPDFASELPTGRGLVELRGPGVVDPGELGGRTDTKLRQQLIRTGGGSSQSEAAVELGLKWIIQHQMPDGGWSFNLNACPNCNGQCTHGVDKGIGADRCGASSMALLPFLGRGYTHKEGPYKKQIEAGIGFLTAMTMKGQGKAYAAGGNMYSQGVAGIVLSESYAMTQDIVLQMPAQSALNYIMAAQDSVGGGWRYSPKQAGDTSATGWQLMALKAGHRAFLQVSPLTFRKAVEFLNDVQQDSGASYGYNGPGDGAGTSAVGLLCRMQLGWKKDHPALQRGADMLAKMGPSEDLYFDYYATQVLHHMEGERWAGWNNRMREKLVNAQSKKGHEAGSWYDDVNGGHGAQAAGRLYCTSLATMILEVYYRYRPRYRQQANDTDFKE
jgi:hypothetical protein